MKYEKPIINITFLREEDMILTSLISEGGDYTDPDFQNGLDDQMWKGEHN